MKQYPSLARLLWPKLLPAYDACFWLVTRHTGHRASGRTTAMAAAFLREVMTGNSAKLWDHWAESAGTATSLNPLKDAIHSLANKLGLKVKIDSFNVLRSVTSDNGRPPSLVMQHDHVTIAYEKLRRAAVEVAALGVKEKRVLDFVSRSLRENIVDEVHNL